MPAGAALAILVIVVIGAIAGLARSDGARGAPPDAQPVSTPFAAPASAPAGSGGSALALLASLPVKGPSPLTGYARVADFGQAWLDMDHDGCDTRDQVLARDLTAVRLRDCKVESGVLVDPYTRTVIHFERGPQSSEAVQIDHVVALADAWRTGAQALSQTRREQLANDPVELLAVDGPTNQAKGDGDAATWLPPNRSFRCTYVAHQVAVKAAYRLWVTPAEHAAMLAVLRICPTMPAPAAAFPG